MTELAQILLGSALFLVASIVHMIGLLYLGRAVRARKRLTALFATLMIILITLAHMAHIGIWAVLLHGIGALPSYSDALYFSLVTYTTVGYGDVTLGDGTRLLGAMAAFAGIVALGMSTAFLVSLFSRRLT
jgi:hypothetical protein